MAHDPIKHAKGRAKLYRPQVRLTTVLTLGIIAVLVALTAGLAAQADAATRPPGSTSNPPVSYSPGSDGRYSGPGGRPVVTLPPSVVPTTPGAVPPSYSPPPNRGTVVPPFSPSAKVCK